MDPEFIESWWDVKYPNYSIRDHSKAIYQKYYAITSPYEMTLENIQESFVDDGNTTILSWHDNSKFKGQKLGYIKETKSFFYEH